jgi:hypothetical protein
MAQQQNKPPVIQESGARVGATEGTVEKAPGAFDFGEAPERENGKLTRNGALQVIRGGGSVIIGGKQIDREQDLPDEADFAGDDEAAQEAARQRLVEQQKLIDAQLNKLGTSKKTGGKNAEK